MPENEEHVVHFFDAIYFFTLGFDVKKAQVILVLPPELRVCDATTVLFTQIFCHTRELPLHMVTGGKEVIWPYIVLVVDDEEYVVNCRGRKLTHTLANLITPQIMPMEYLMQPEFDTGYYIHKTIDDNFMNTDPVGEDTSYPFLKGLAMNFIQCMLNMDKREFTNVSEVYYDKEPTTLYLTGFIEGDDLTNMVSMNSFELVSVESLEPEEIIEGQDRKIYSVGKVDHETGEITRAVLNPLGEGEDMFCITGDAECLNDLEEKLYTLQRV